MKERKRVSGYCTKYALTKGVIQCNVEIKMSELHTQYVYGLGPHVGSVQMRIGRDFFESLDDALANARDRAKRKLKSLDKARALLVKLVEEPKVLERE